MNAKDRIALPESARFLIKPAEHGMIPIYNGLPIHTIPE
jgi:hypothetical protein